ncbi:MAG: HD domain-containing protein [Egibacteraceae bacterium]
MTKVRNDGDWHWAREIAEVLLKPIGQRWMHVQGVGEQAKTVARVLPADERGVLISAAYLHDIGYAPALHRTGCHQLDGAFYLKSLGHARIAELVAHHSSARFEVELRGLNAALADFHDERSMVSDALTYCDMTTGPGGEPMSAKQRFSDIAVRYDTGHVVLAALKQARPDIEQAVKRFE